jgi:peptidoglycan/LPS O-acetylase OafA/YrhL
VTTTQSSNPLTRVLAQRHMPALDGLRAVSVFVVMVYHFGLVQVPGDLGVSAFFVLSGFLITWLLLKENRATGSVSLSHFYTRRVLRIFPAYYAFLVVSFVVDHLRNDPWSPALRYSAVFYVVNYFNAFFGHPNTSVAHAWSLAIEEQFYLLWPLAFLLLRRRSKRAALGMIVGIIVAVGLWRSIAFLVIGASKAYVYNAFETRFDNIAIGCLLALLLERGNLRGAVGATARWSWLPMLTLGLLVVSRVFMPTTYHYSAGFTVDAALIAIFIVQVLQLYREPLWSWLELPLVRYLGTISYPLYLYHQWGLGAVQSLHALPEGVQFLAGTLLCIAVASGSYFVVERPFLRLKRGLETTGTQRTTMAHVHPPRATA